MIAKTLMMDYNNIDNHKVIYVNTSGHRFEEPARDGHYRHKKFYSAMPQRVMDQGVLDLSTPGPSRRPDMPWPQRPAEPAYDHQPVGPRVDVVPPRTYYPNQHLVFDNIPQQKFVPKSVLVPEPDEQPHHHQTLRKLGQF